MEEQQIQNFVHRVSRDKTFYKELALNTDSVIAREGFSPAIAKVVRSLVLQLTMDEEMEPSLRRRHFAWWH